jgi:hypothetical protein
MALLGLLVIAGFLGLAIHLPHYHCVYDGDSGNCADRTPLKYALGLLGILMGGGLLLWSVRKDRLDPWGGSSN